MGPNKADSLIWQGALVLSLLDVIFGGLLDFIWVHVINLMEKDLPAMCVQLVVILRGFWFF